MGVIIVAKILVVDDELAILRLIKKALELNNHEVMALPSVSSMNIEEMNAFNLIILDVMMPNENGFEICKRIRHLVDSPIIFMTAKSDENSIVHGLSVGGDDYILKPFSIHELNARVEAHLRREIRPKRNSTKIIIDGDIFIDLEAKKIIARGTNLILTKKQYSICELLLLNKGKVFSKDYIYDKVYSMDSDSQISTVTEHISAIRKKFSKFNLSPINTIWGVGYIWE